MSKSVTLAPMKSSDEVSSHTAMWSEEKKQQYSEYVKRQRRDYEPLMQEKDRVIIEFGKGPAIQALRPSSEIRIRNNKAKMTPMLGKPFHTIFSLENGKDLRPREGAALNAASIFSHLQRDDVNFLPTATNAELYDNTSNQTITQEDIAKMKAEGKSGDEIIRAVAAASKTFDGKTEFSQEKWLKKKLQKYNTDVTTIRPTPATLLKASFEREPRRVLFLRDDTLAQLMSWANVGAGQRTLVVETAGGLVTGTAAYRQGGQGQIIAVHIGANPAQGLVEDLNLDTETRKSIHNMPLGALRMIPTVNPAAPAQLPSPVAAYDPITPGGPPLTGAVAAFGETANVLAQGAHSLILCTHYCPKDLLCELLPHLLPSSPFVVYSQYPELLSAAQLHLVGTRTAVNVQIMDTWYRPQQVLPNRTHPHMTMNASGGYLLIGTTLSTSSFSGNTQSSIPVSNVSE